MNNSNSHNYRIKTNILLSNLDEQKIQQQKTSTLRINQEKNLFIEKYKPKFKSFKSDKKVNKSNMGNRARDYYTNVIKSSKKNGWMSNKKGDNSLKKYMSKSSKEKTINKYFYSSENMKIKNQKKMQDNLCRNNNNKINYNNYLNKSNYVIKVKTKMNQNEKNINNIHINEKKKELATNLILESIQNVDFNKNNLSDIFKNSKNHRRHCSNIISRKYIENHIESQKKQKIILEKINFVQLWWKTIFQIIKIQKNVRGFLYRQRLIEELDREEIIVDNLLFLIKSYKKIVFNIFIFKLSNYKSSIRYCFLKWNEKINKGIIIQSLLKVYGKQISHNNFNNTSSEFIKFDYDCDKNIFRDSTNSLMNNIEILNDKNLNGNINDFENYLRPSVNARESLKFSNEVNDKQLEINCYDKINNNNLNKKNKFNKSKSKSKNKKTKKKEIQKEKEKENTNYNNINININSKNKNVKQKMENDYNKNYHLVVSKPSVLSNNNKIIKKKSNNSNILNGNKSELKTKIKRKKMANKLISKEIFPFSIINNNENISNLTNINPLYNSSNNIILLNKKNKIYENHLYENKKKKENKNKNRDDNNVIKIKKSNNIKSNKVVKKIISEPQKFQEENNISSTNNTKLSHIKNNSNLNDNQNISENIHKVNNPLPVSCFQNKSEISNNKNNSSMSIESSFLISIKSNIKQVEPIRISLNKYFNFWYKISFQRIIKNRLRSIFLFLKTIQKIQKGQIIAFFENFKLYHNCILCIRIKNLFNKYRIKLVKKAITKCYLYKMFHKYDEIVSKKVILQKLKEYYYKESRKKMIREIHNEIKENNNIKIERKKNIINKNELISNVNQRNNKLMLDTTNINNSMLNSINLEEHINKIIEYNYTNGSQPNQSINQIKKTLNIDLNNNNHDKDIVSQINQLTMVINLIEHLRLKKCKNKTNFSNLLKYFKKWKKFGKNEIIFRDNDNFRSEYELYSKSEHMSISSNSTSKYVPVRGLKYFQGKIKPKNNPRKYKISNLIEKYKTTTIATTTDYSTQTYKKNEINENKLNLNNGSFKTFNDFNSLECNNNSNSKVNNINHNETQIQQKQNWIYQKKTLGISLKSNFNKNLNNTSSTFSKINNYPYVNDSCFTSLDNYSSNFLNILNNANFGFNDCKIVPLILLDNGNDSKTINNYNLDNEINSRINESFDIRNIQNKYGIRRMNKIEEKEICFYPNKNNDKNLININSEYKSKYGEDIGIFSEIKKYYDEDIFISDKDRQMKKFNSFIFNTFNNTIIITQEVKNKRSKSK